jgi:tRNA G18 (ribose-2'-O)-methylase SpoU
VDPDGRAPAPEEPAGAGALVPVDDPADPRLEAFRSLNDPAGRRELEQREAIFVVEGRLGVDRLLEADHRIRSVLVDERKLGGAAGLVDAARARGATVYVASRQVVEATVGFSLHRGVVAVAERPVPADPAEVLAAAARGVPGGPAPVVAVMEGLNDHENIGALFRNAAAFGVAAVLGDPTCADPLYRRSVRVSMGHVLHVPFARLAPWPDGLELVRAAGFAVAALVPHPEAAAPGAPAVALAALPSWLDDDDERRWRGAAVLVGAEGPGLTPAAVTQADVLVTIPMAGGVDSVNVATAAAIAFHTLAGR